MNEKPRCAVRGLVAPGAMCSKSCGSAQPCPHKVEALPVSDELRALRARAGLTTRAMSTFAMMSDGASWSRAERTGIMDPSRLLLVRARVAAMEGRDAEALRLLREGM